MLFQIKADVVKAAFLAYILYAQHNGSFLSGSWAVNALRNMTACHAIYKSLLRKGRAFPFCNLFSISDDNDSMRKLHDLIHFVAYKNDTDTASVQPLHHREKRIHLFLCECRCRLVHDQDSYVVR